MPPVFAWPFHHAGYNAALPCRRRPPSVTHYFPSLFARVAGLFALTVPALMRLALRSSPAMSSVSLRPLLRKSSALNYRQDSELVLRLAQTLARFALADDSQSA
ncbi:Uncharacterised protein [Vibrio cholerae]|nr:Uncharacterised protein [Vibrio cholerae]